MRAVEFDKAVRCHGSVGNGAQHPVVFRTAGERVRNTELFPAGPVLTMRVGNRFCGMAVRRRVNQPRVVSPAEQAAVGVLIAADLLQQSFAAICEGHGITTDQYRVLRILRRSEEHTSELQSRPHLVCRLLLEKKKTKKIKLILKKKKKKAKRTK